MKTPILVFQNILFSILNKKLHKTPTKFEFKHKLLNFNVSYVAKCFVIIKVIKKLLNIYLKIFEHLQKVIK